MGMRFWEVVAVSIIVAVTILLGWRVLNWVWLRPRKLEKLLRSQGLNGNSYKLLLGDLKELIAGAKEAKSKTMTALSHDIIPQIFPVNHKFLIKYGKLYFVWIGPRPLVNIIDPKLIKEILSKYNLFQKPKAANPLSKFVICGLFTLEGEKWAKHRRIINPGFHHDKLKHMLPAIYLSCREMIEKWEEIVHVGSSELNVWPDLQSLSGNIISSTAFGSIHEEGRRIVELLQEQSELAMQTTRTLYIPGSRFLPTKRNKRMKEIEKLVKGSIMSIIETKLKSKKPKEASNKDLLDMLLELNYKEINQDDNKNIAMTIEEVIDECKVFYFAGQETTASLLVWTMVLLCQHQDWQEQARQEVLNVFGSKPPNHEGLSHLKITSMILNEVLRLYPPAPVTMRMNYEETKVGGITLPAGTIIQVPIIMLHHDQELWGDDAKEFKPERFSEGVAKATNGLGSFLPFSGGPRICVGQNFALMEAKIAMAMILQRFSFLLSTSYSHAPSSIITLQPQYGAHLILHKL